MSLLPFVVVTVGGCALALTMRRRERLSTAISIAALILAVVAAAAIRPAGSTTIGGATISATDYARVLLLIGAVLGLLLTLLGAASEMPRDLPAATLGGLGASGLALGAADPVLAVLAASAGAFLGVLATLAPPRSAIATAVAARQLRMLAIGTTLGVVAAAWASRPLEVLAAEPEAAGLGLLALAAAVAVRWGAIPFHRWTARLAETAPEIALPTLLAWGAAVVAAVVLTIAETTIGSVGSPFGAERAILVTVGATTLLLGVAAAYLHDDLGHIVTYSIAADAGIVLFALGALEPSVWVPARLWLLAFVAGRTAFAAWAAAVRAAFGTHRLRDLGGWARRAPILAGALVVVAVSTVGWPGLAAFDARMRVVDAATADPLTAIALIGTLAHVGYFGRIAAVGLGRRSSAVARGLDPWPRWPPHGSPPRVADAARLWQANRGPAAALIVLLLAVLALVIAAGGLGGSRAAAGPVPRPTPGQLETPSATPAASATVAPPPTLTPPPTIAPSASPGGGSPSAGEGSEAPTPPTPPTPGSAGASTAPASPGSSPSG